MLSLSTGSVSWWEGNGWGCQPVWSEMDGPGVWRPTRVDGCFLKWNHVEMGQSAVAAVLTATALPLAVLLAYRSFKKTKPPSGKNFCSQGIIIFKITARMSMFIITFNVLQCSTQ